MNTYMAMVFACIFGLVALIGAPIIQYAKLHPEPYAHNVGDIVYVKLDSRKGVVTYRCRVAGKRVRYSVRFAVRATATDSRLLSEDGTLHERPYTEAIFQGFELADSPRLPTEKSE